MENAFDLNKEFSLKELPDVIYVYTAIDSKVDKIVNDKVSGRLFFIYPDLTNALIYEMPQLGFKGREYDMYALVEARKIDLFEENDEDKILTCTDLIFKSVTIKQTYSYDEVVNLYIKSNECIKDLSAPNSLGATNKDDSILEINGQSSHVWNSGSNSKAIANGKYSKVVNHGFNSVAIANGEKSSVITTGDNSYAAAQNDSNVTVTGKYSIAYGIDSKVRGVEGSLLICVLNDFNGNQIACNYAFVDCISLFPNVFYTIDENGNFIEAA